MTTETGEREVTARDIIGMLPLYAGYRDTERRAKRDKELMGKTLKQYLEEHPEETLFDGETQLEARLQERRGVKVLDASSIPSELLVWLGEHGCLLLDNTAFRALDGKFPEVLKVRDFLYPGPGSVSLQVGKRE